MAKTIAEKILSNHSGKDLHAGDYALAEVDFCLGQDGTSGLIIDALAEINAKELKAKSKFCMVIDHSAPSPNIGVSAIHKKMRGFADSYDLKLYDVGCGVCHQVVLESGNVLPGDLVTGADSHTCTYGAIGALSTGFGSTDLAVTLASGIKIEFKRTGSIFTSAEVTTGTKEPGIASPWHITIAKMAALPYCKSYKKDRVTQLERDIAVETASMLKHYGQRERDSRKIMSMEQINHR